MEEKTKILLVEDEPSVAKGLQYGLKEEGFQVFWAATGSAGLQFLNDEHPHILLLDVRLPDVSGFDLCRRIRSEGQKLPIIMLTARDTDADKVLGLELGADDYVVKPFGFRELVSRIRAQIRRSYGELSDGRPGGVLRFGNVSVDMDKLRTTKAEKEIDLTPLEIKILKALTTRPDQPVSRERLLEEAWGYGNYFGEERTVDVHIRHLREKLEDDPAAPRYIQTVRGFGYRFCGDVKKS